MTGRHVRPKGQPRRSWPLLDPDFDRTLPVFEPDAPVLSESQTYELLDQMDGDLFREVRRGPLPLGTAARNTAEVFEHLAPRRRPVRTAAGRVRSLIRRFRGIRFSRPSYTGSILPRPTEPVFRAAVTLLIGITLGYGYHAMTLQAPQDCARAFTLADRTFVDYENVSTAVVLMSTRGQSEYEAHEADAIQLWEDIDAARAEYRDAKAACLGGAR